MDTTMADTTMAQCSIRACSNENLVNSWVARTERVRVEFLRCRKQAVVQWRVARPEIAIVWVRSTAGDTRTRVDGCRIDQVRRGKATLWFYPEGMDAEGELTGESAYDCAGVFADPCILPLALRQALAEPLVGFCHDPLGQAFIALAAELAQPDEVLPFFTEGWVMQALAHVARAAKAGPAKPRTCSSGLAPWQLRRATEMLRANLTETMPMSCLAGARKLSVSHFARAFKASTGKPPHQWLVDARIETAQRLLADSHEPLVDIAGMCGFADQSHFSRVFGRAVGSSPGMWRREHRA